MSGLLPVRAVPLILALILGVCAGVLPHITANNALGYYFPPDAPAVVLDRHVRETFPQDQVILAVFTGEGLYSDAFLGGLDRLTETMRAHPAVEHVVSVVNLDHIVGTTDTFAVEKLLGSKERAHHTTRERLDRVRSDRFATGLLAAEDGSALAVIVRPRGAEDSLARLHLVTALREAVREAGIESNLYGLTGDTALDVAELHSMIRDTAIFVPGTTVVGLLLVWFMFARLLAVVLAFVAVTAVSMSTVAILVIWGKPYTLVAAMSPPLMTALTIATVIHLFSGLRNAERIGRRGVDRVLWTLDEVTAPANASLLTTGVGLASLGTSPIHPIAEFGLAAAGGCVVLWFVTLKLLPPLIASLDHGSWIRTGGGARRLDRLLFGLTRVGIRHAGWVVLCTAALLAAGTPAILRIVVETDLYAFFSDSHPLLRTTRVAEQKLSGITFVQIYFRGSGPRAFRDLSNLHRVESAQVWLDGHPAVEHTDSMVDVVKEINWGFNAENPTARRLPDDPGLLDQYLQVYDGRDLYDFVDRELSQTLISVSLRTRGAGETGRVLEEIRAGLNRLDMGALRYEIVGIGRLMADQQKLLITGQIYSLLCSLVIIFGFLVWMWRSLAQGVLTMIPNIAPIMFIFIMMGMLGIWLDMGTAIIASVAVGISVDDTMHLYHGYREQRHRYVPMVTALARCFRRSGRACVATTVILAAQFLMLVASPFHPTANFGLLTAVGLVAALILDLLFLPALIVVWERTAQFLRLLVARPRRKAATRQFAPSGSGVAARKRPGRP